MPPKRKAEKGSTGSSKRVDRKKNAQKPAKAPKVKAILPEKELAQIEKAKKTNPPDVLVIDADKLINNYSLLASYIGLPDSRTVREWLENSSYATGILADWNAARKVNYHTGEGEGGAPTVKRIFKDYIHEPQSIPQHVLDASYPIVSSSKSQARICLFWLVAMHQLIIQEPKLFLDLQARRQGTRPTLAGHHSEDWHRAFQLLRAHWRHHSPARSNEVDPDSPDKKQNNKATPVKYLTMEDQRNVRTNEEGQLSGRANMNDLTFQRIKTDSEDTNSQDEDTTSQDDQDLEGFRMTEISDAINKCVIKHTPFLYKETDKDPRPKIDEAAQRELLTGLFKRAKILYPTRQTLQESFDGTLTTPISGQEAAAQFSQSQRTVVDMVNKEGDALENTEDELGNESTTTQVKREHFWMFQRTLSNISAGHPIYAESCDHLELDHKKPIVGTVELFPWQVIGISWLAKMSESSLRGGLCGYDMGLGKTITAYTLIQWDADRKEREGGHTYKPTLIAYPTTASGVWKDELRAYFPNLHIFIFIGSKDMGKVSEREHILNRNAEALIKRIRSLDPDDPATGRTVILTTYTTWLRRTLYLKKNTEGSAQIVARKKKMKGLIPQHPSPGKDLEAEDDEEEENEEEKMEEVEEVEEKEEDAEILKALAIRIPKGLFGRVILDEAHKLKSTYTRTFRSIALIEADTIICLTATVMINKPADFTGVISLYWRPEWTEEDPDESSKVMDNDAVKDTSDNGDDTFSDLSLKPYRDALKTIDSYENWEDMLTMVNLKPLLPVLNPKRFRHYATGPNQMDAATAQTVIQPISKLLQLRKTLADTLEVNGKIIQVGDKIPPYRIITIEVEMSEEQERRYKGISKELVPRLGSGVDKKTKEGRINIASVRRLTHAALNVDLDKLISSKEGKSKKTDAAAVTKWHDEFGDHGATFYFKETKPGNLLPPYRERIGMCQYMAFPSPKLQVLAGCAEGVCLKQKKKLLVFCYWPLNLWHIESFLTTAGFNVGTLRAKHSAEDRENIIPAFNDPASPMQILVTSLRVGATSYNLQKACHHVIFMDIPPGTNSLLQAIGRVFRIGQENSPFIWVVTLDHSYDQVIQCRAAKKFIGQIAGQAEIKITDDEINAYIAKAVEGLDDDDKDLYRPTAKDAHSYLLEEQCAELYRQMIGLRSQRHQDEWRNTGNNFRLKDELPVEQAFRTSLLSKGDKSKSGSNTKVVSDHLGSSARGERIRKRNQAKNKPDSTGGEGDHGQLSIIGLSRSPSFTNFDELSDVE